MNNNTDKKPCPFCAESIQAAAIKCRFCGEWLESPAKNGQRPDAGNAPSTVETKKPAAQQADNAAATMFEGRPSYAGMAGSFVLCAVLFIAAVIIMAVKSANEETQSVKTFIGLAMMLFAALWLLVKMLVLKSTFYRLTPERLEYQRGLLSRKVDNIDLFRISDYKMDRTVIDRLLGIGTIRLFSTDKSDPEFLIFKIKNPQQVFEILSKATFAADRRANTFHIE